eukprot:325262_1
MLGSSMRVTRACDIPSYCYARDKNPGRFVLVNLQKTNYDECCEESGGFRVGSKIDEFFQMVMDILGIKVDTFTDDAMINSITDEMKKIKVDPDFKMYDIIQEKK